LFGRRRGGRRDGEINDIYVDRYRPRELLMVTAMLILAVVDGVWTLAHLRRGVEEANPALRWAWEQGGPIGFSIVKFSITALATFFLLLHSRVRATRLLLPIAVFGYTALMAIHIATEISVRGAWR
jgi:hypothetical protein